MALKSVIGNWILAGTIIGVFVYLPQIIDFAVPHDEGPSSSGPSADIEDDSAPEPLEIRIPTIEVDLELPQFGAPNPFPETLSLCGSMSISHAPRAGEDLIISEYRQFVAVNEVNIAMAPVEEACFSSGFGLRNSTLHKGIDYHNRQPVEIYAAANGIVREKEYRDDYGNMIVLEHGNGVFTRYAHLRTLRMTR
ncbi:MAG: M23 family metallopeptidase [Pseudomonadota bacterium]